MSAIENLDGYGMSRWGAGAATVGLFVMVVRLWELGWTAWGVFWAFIWLGYAVTGYVYAARGRRAVIQELERRKE